VYGAGQLTGQVFVFGHMAQTVRAARILVELNRDITDQRWAEALRERAVARWVALRDALGVPAISSPAGPA